MFLKSPWSSMEVTNTRVPVSGGGTGSGRRGFWQSLREILSLCQFPSPVVLGGPVSSAIATAFMTQAEEMLEDMKDLCHQQDHLAQEAGKAKKEWEKMCKQVQDLRSVVRGELESLEQELKSKKDELAQLEARKEMFEASGFAPEVSVRAPWMLMGASAEPSAPKKKKKKKQKRHPGLPSEEGQEYYKSYLVHL